MKKRIAFVVVLAYLVHCTYSLPHYSVYTEKNAVVISERVGDVIDQEEREQFNLFPGIDGFEGATFYHIAEGGYEVEIITEDAKLIAVNRDSLAISLLRDYINQYEEIRDSKAEFEKKWKIAGYDDLGQPITEHEIAHVRSRRFGCIGGTNSVIKGALIGCLGGGLILLIAMPALSMSDAISDETAEGGFFYGTAICTVLGALLGSPLLRHDAVKAIKESRKPRLIE